jgi:NhaP-type Na+/H+ or K+/H+ antiporter
MLASFTNVFVILLPPIIFNSGYHLHRARFFRYIPHFRLFVRLGTVICTVVVASIMYALAPHWSPAHLRAHGVCSSATQIQFQRRCVFIEKWIHTPVLHLVFGESVINDAVGLVRAFFGASGGDRIRGSRSTLVTEVLQFVLTFQQAFSGRHHGIVLGLLSPFLKHIDLRHTPIPLN